MKKYKNSILVTGLALCCSIASICTFSLINKAMDVSDYGYDVLNNCAAQNRVDIKKLETAGELDYSKTYVQYATDGNAYYLRCATAVKGEIASITYSRSDMVGADNNVIQGRTINVTSLYKFLLADGENVYYNGSDLVNEESEATKDYYWACYTLKYDTPNCYFSDFNISLAINGQETENTRSVSLASLIEDNDMEFAKEVHRYDETYHYYACTANGFETFEKKEEHTGETVSLVEPTLTSTGLTEGVKCSICGYNSQKELPALSDEHYDITYSTGLIDEIVCDTIIYTLKDKTIGEYSFTIAGEPLTEYIHAGSSYYSIQRWNQIFTNQVATVDSETNTLTITLKEGTTTVVKASDGVSNLDGVLDLTLYNEVIITGNGVLDITYSTMQDGINANNLTIDEGTVVNLTGFSKEDKSAIKVYQSLIINGTFNISNFGYGQAITKDKEYKISTIIGENGVYNITDVVHGIYAWSSTQTYPYISCSGKLNINASSEGIYLAKASDVVFDQNSVVTISADSSYGIYNTDGSIILRDNTNVSIDAGTQGLYDFRNLIVGNLNGDDYENVEMNTASLSVTSDENVIQTDSTSAKIVFHSTGKISIKSTQNKSKTGIQFSQKSAALFMIKAADMEIVNADNAIGTWVSASSLKTIYEYEAPYNKLKIVNCNKASYSKYSTSLSTFTNDNVEIVNS